MDTLTTRIRNAFDRQVRAWDRLLAQPWLADVRPTPPNADVVERRHADGRHVGVAAGGRHVGVSAGSAADPASVA